MGELAEAAQMSRSALYLVFPSKGQFFTEVASRSLAENFDEIRKGILRFKTVEEKLAFAFEVWSVRGFERVNIDDSVIGRPRSAAKSQRLSQSSPWI
jgi:AcrR family transcriptional regulator